MKTTSSILLFFCLHFTNLSAQNNGEWLQLFNGKDLTGWDIKITGHDLNDNYLNTFRVENGILKCSYDQYKNFDNKFGHIYYRTPYSHYRLRVEYRFTGNQTPGGAEWNVRNSGVMLHSQPAASLTKDQPFPISLEAQFLGGLGDGKPRTTANLCTPGTMVEMNGKLNTEHCINSTSKTYDGDQWVTVEMLVLGDSLVQHIIDGKVVFEYNKPVVGEVGEMRQYLGLAGGWFGQYEEKPLKSGHIALQAESHPIEFRKVELLDLSKKYQPQVIRLYEGAAPGSESWTQQETWSPNPWDDTYFFLRNVTTPTLTAYLPDPAKATGTSVIVAPGGGFHFLSWKSEGSEVAEWLAERGIAAFVLKYRLVNTGTTDEEFKKKVIELFSGFGSEQADSTRILNRNREMASVAQLATQDGLQAIRLVRQRAAEWKISPDRIGILGFSAGARVSAGAAAQYVDAASRPDFVAPIYGGMWGDFNVPADAPPLFALVATDDKLAVKTTMELYEKWQAAGRPAELHVYSKGGHGFGMNKKGMPSDDWIERFGEWLKASGF
ncbi:MAG: family 16 glycoside hydrolase [Bacteroidota bacterium]